MQALLLTTAAVAVAAGAPAVIEKPSAKSEVAVVPTKAAVSCVPVTVNRPKPRRGAALAPIHAAK
jgi:hypothetical protein